MDALGLLIADHNRVRGLFARYEDAHEKDDAAQAAELVSTIVEELTVHMAIEEQTFYPAIHELNEEIAETVDEGVEEHHVAKLLIEELRTLSPDDDVWVAKVTVLIESVEHHLDEEEEELFPSVRGASASGWLDELALKLEANKSQLGAPLLADKIDMKNAQLASLASAQQIPGRSSMSHEELAATVAPN